jgi:rhodanese-related sulfurtransferase
MIKRSKYIINFFKKYYSIISKLELENKIKNKEKYILIDVRTPNETEINLIETAKKIPLNELEESLKLNDNEFKNKYNFNKPNKKDEIIFYCNINLINI